MLIDKMFKTIIYLGFTIVWMDLTACGTINHDSTEPKYGAGESFTVQLPNMQPEAVELELVKIPAGTFQMGSPPDEDGREDNEGPVRTVTISTDFYIGKYEVTQAQWMTLMDENLSTEKGDNLPVNKVSWDDCQEFIKRLNEYTGQTAFRLPTEAETEYASRGGTSGISFLGEEHNPDTMTQYAWFRENSEEYMQPVGQLKPNPFGLYDILGNVWEWCYDWYAPAYPNVDETDPMGPANGEEKVIRGGSWMARFEYMRSADRGKFTPDNQRNTGGFRVVWSEMKVQ